MAIVEADSAEGVEDSRLRPGARVRMGDVLLRAHKDQCAAYNAILGAAVPNGAAALVAPAHVHDGTNGAVIPIPVAQQVMGANLPPQATVSVHEDFYPLIWTPFVAPPGCTKVRWVGMTTSPVTADYLRAGLTDTSGTWSTPHRSPDITDEERDRFPGGGQLKAMAVDIDVTAGAVNILRVDCWDGAYTRDGESLLLGPRDLVSWSLFPLVGNGPKKVQGPQPVIGDSLTFVPSTTAHLGAHSFTSIPERLFDDDNAICSYILHAMAMNDALLWELLQTTAAGQLADNHTNDQRYKAHNHHGLNTNKTLRSGPQMLQPLGAWSYGTARRKVSTSAHMNNDESPNGRVWTGRIHGITPTATGYQLAAEHRVRLPSATSGDQTGAATKYKFAAWVRSDGSSKAGNVEVRARFQNAQGTVSAAYENAPTITAQGLSLVQIDNLEVPTTTNDAGIVTLQVDISQSNSPVAGSQCCLYGGCLWEDG